MVSAIPVYADCAASAVRRASARWAWVMARVAIELAWPGVTAGLLLSTAVLACRPSSVDDGEHAARPRAATVSAATRRSAGRRLIGAAPIPRQPDDGPRGRSGSAARSRPAGAGAWPGP